MNIVKDPSTGECFKVEQNIGGFHFPYHANSLTCREPSSVEYLGFGDLPQTSTLTSLIIDGTEYVTGPAPMFEIRENGSDHAVWLTSTATGGTTQFIHFLQNAVVTLGIHDRFHVVEYKGTTLPFPIRPRGIRAM
jgi:hypothetical protein